MLVLTLGLSAEAQNQLGLHQGNFSGATGLTKNPASFQLSTMAWDFVLVSGGAFVENEYAYIRNATIPEVLFSNYDLVQAGEGTNLNTGALEYDFFDANKPMDNSVNAFAGYPSFVGRINRTLSVGLFSKTRVAFAGNQIDPFWSYPKLDQWPYGETRVADPIWVGAMAWSEIGINVAKGLKVGGNPLAVGLNAKYLVGHESVYGFVPNKTEVTLYQPHYLANTQEAYFGFTDFENSLLEPPVKGAGLGIDLGVVYAIKGEGNETKWQLSFSIVDLGMIRFTEAEHHHVTADNVSVLRRPVLAQIQSLSDFAAVVSNEVMGSPTASRIGSAYNLLTPAGVVAGAEFRATDHFILEAETGRRLVLSPRQIYRENYVAVSGRFETKWFEYGLPIVLYNDSQLRLGSWIRIGPLVIGSDHIGTWFVKQAQLTGADVYFAVRLNEFTFSSKNNNKRHDPEDCYW